MRAAAHLPGVNVRETVVGSGLDIALLGAIVAGLGLSLGSVAGSADASPSFVRFFQVPADTTLAGVMPQDKALLLLTDPRTADAAAGASGSTGGLDVVLVGVGAVLIAAGIAVAYRDETG